MFVVKDELAPQLIEYGLLDILKNVFPVGTKQEKQEALWLLSNIAANSEKEAELLIDSQLIMNLIYSARDVCFTVRKESLWALTNICHSVSNVEKLNCLIPMEIMTVLIDVLQNF